MIVTPRHATIYLPPSDTPRSEGVHVSGIIRCIAKEQGILKKDLQEELSLVDVREITDPVAILRMNIGLAWEQHYILKILGSQGVIDHPGELEIDGIYLTHDGESVSTVVHERISAIRLLVHECKATYKSTRTVGNLEPKDSNWMWLAQLKAYCKALETQYARMHVLFLCGDYKYPITPQLGCWDVYFDQEEIEGNWQLMTDYRDYQMGLI